MDVNIVGKPGKRGPGEYRFISSPSPNIPTVYHTYRHQEYNPIPGGYNIARTMLEVTRIPKCWVYKLNRMEEVWVPGPFNRQIFIDSGVNPGKIFIIPSPVELTPPGPVPPYPLNRPGKFKFLAILNYRDRHRKGLDILLKAYTETFRPNDNVCLVLKTKIDKEALYEEYKLPADSPEIMVLDRVLSHEEMFGLYKAVDCYVLATRGEGIGRPFLDAMNMGVPIIATGWSGHAEFLNQENSFPLRYKLKKIEEQYFLKYPGFYGASWAEPDLHHLKSLLKQIFQFPAAAGNKVEQAYQDLKKMSQKDIAGEISNRLSKPLDKIPPTTASYLIERLFPLFYPGNNDTGQNVFKNKQDFYRVPQSAALVGARRHLARAAHFCKYQEGIKQLLFPGESPRSYTSCTWDEVKKKAGIVIIADKINHLPCHYYKTLEMSKGIPIYFFA